MIFSEDPNEQKNISQNYEEVSNTVLEEKEVRLGRRRSYGFNKILYMIIRYIIGIVIVCLIGLLSRWFGLNNKALMLGKTVDLEEAIEEGLALTVGKYVEVDNYYPLVDYASEIHTLTVEDSSLIDTGEDHYYLVMLNDFSFITVQVRRQEEIKAFDAFIDHLPDYINGEDTVDSIELPPIVGKLQKISDSDLRSFYSQALDIFDVSIADDTVYDLVINTTEVRAENVIFYLVVPLAAVSILLIVIFVISSKRKERHSTKRYILGIALISTNLLAMLSRLITSGAMIPVYEGGGIGAYISELTGYCLFFIIGILLILLSPKSEKVENSIDSI